MKRILNILLLCITTFVSSTIVKSQNVYAFENITRQTAPFTSDQINIIIMMLCISGTALILLLIFSILQKNKKK